MRVLALLVALPFVSACASATPASQSPPDTPPSAETAAPAGLRSFPPTTAVALEPGRYSSQPPFEVPFTFEITVAGWGTAHHHGEFFDVIQPVALGVSPTRWIAFARPQTLHGTDEDVDAAGLTPEQVIGVFRDHGDIDLGPATPYSIGGIDGLAADMSTESPAVEAFGGPAGDLQLDPAYEGRTVFLTVGDAPLLVMVFAPRGQLAEAWAESQPIIDSITW
jgi:hypothetical protein